jgi:D-aminopeptidase
MRKRLRDLGIQIGIFLPGEHNAITDVPGVLVGHSTVIHDEPRVARTGVTMVVPQDGRIWEDYAFAGYYSFNGNGEMTGLPWLEESGMLGSPIGITNTHQVGVVRDALVAYAVETGHAEGWLLPVVAETYDGWLNDIDAFHVKQEHAYQALRDARGGPVVEGNVGGGTGMICHSFKGGIGTSSRLVEIGDGRYTVGALVQANYGSRHLLRVDGVPVGRLLDASQIPEAWVDPPRTSSIIVIIATDAPLLPVQCRRLAQRATVGLARVGGTGHNGSGDIFLAFATGNRLPARIDAPVRQLEMLPHHRINRLFDAAAEAVEESILNALTAAETMTGFKGHTVSELPLDDLQRIMELHQSWKTR